MALSNYRRLESFCANERANATQCNCDALVSILPAAPAKIGTLLGFIVYQIYLNENEDDVTRKKLQDVEVLISPIGRSSGL